MCLNPHPLWNNSHQNFKRPRNWKKKTSKSCFASQKKTPQLIHIAGGNAPNSKEKNLFFVLFWNEPSGMNCSDTCMCFPFDPIPSIIIEIWHRKVIFLNFNFFFFQFCNFCPNWLIFKQVFFPENIEWWSEQSKYFHKMYLSKTNHRQNSLLSLDPNYAIYF